MSRSRPKRLPPGARLRITTSAPVVIVRGPRSPDVFSYTDAQWVKVVAAHPACSQHQLLVDLEAAGQRYQAGRRDSRLRLQVRVSQARAALIRDALWAWSKATGDTELKVSRVHHSRIEYGPPTGKLIRYLEAALSPILGEDVVGREALIKAIRRARG